MQHGPVALTGRGRRFEQQDGVEAQGVQAQVGNTAEREQSRQVGGRQRFETDSELRWKQARHGVMAEQWQRGRVGSLRDQELVEG